MICLIYLTSLTNSTNLLGGKRFTEYQGIEREPLSSFIRATFEYHDSSIGFVKVSVTSFNAESLLQEELKEIVPGSDWVSLQQDGFKFFLMQ